MTQGQWSEIFLSWPPACSSMCLEPPRAEATFFSLCSSSSHPPQPQPVQSLTPRGCLIIAHPCLSDTPVTLSPLGGCPQPPRKASRQNTSQGSIFVCKLTHSPSLSLSLSLSFSFSLSPQPSRTYAHAHTHAHPCPGEPFSTVRHVTSHHTQPLDH